jgi:1,4-alpha-glucan branching enzyme
VIKRTLKGDAAKVTFALPADTATLPVSVVGDFNGWNPHAHPLRKRSNGTCSVVVDLPPGRAYRFRYLADGGWFFDEFEADAIEPNGYGQTHSLLVV